MPRGAARLSPLFSPVQTAALDGWTMLTMMARRRRRRRPCFLLLLLIPCEALTISPAFLSQKSATASWTSPSALYGILDFRNDNDNDNDDDDEDNREKVRVPRGGRRRRYEEENSYNQEEYETTEERPYYDDDEDEDEEYYEDDDDDDDDDEEYEEVDYEYMYEKETTSKSEYDQDILIPNPILDQVDPEGAGERFGEIAKDPIFWRDVLIVVAVFNFCEYVAQVPFMDGPYN
jgi:hypothetical protein